VRCAGPLRYSDRVFDEWGFAGRFPYGKGLLCLFSGPPGTGKTMAAGVIAREIGVDLFQVDLSAVVSKWIGETEKTLARIFDEAQRAQAALLFDEADSLFGRRTEQKTSTDRYGNLEVNYLLQRVENYEGLVILTSNFEQNIDEAFKRRLRFSIHFPFPDAEARARIWRVLLPSEANVADDIDFDEVAERFDLAGGNIKNAVLRAAFDAAQSECAIGREQLIRAALEEYRGMGKLVRDED
jgi:SpoVK/Ycf46/Vps4 family AAA+-type ATPase